MIYMWQHLGRVYLVQYRPSWFLTELAIQCEYYWCKLGSLVAVLGSYLHYFQLYFHELALSAYELGYAGLRCALSWLWLAQGFVETALSYAKPELIYVGTALLGLVVVGLLAWYFKYDWKKWMSDAPPQYESCDSCHDNSETVSAADKAQQAELSHNSSVIKLLENNLDKLDWNQLSSNSSELSSESKNRKAPVNPASLSGAVKVWPEPAKGHAKTLKKYSAIHGVDDDGNAF
jgi:hypothetical protein